MEKGLDLKKLSREQLYGIMHRTGVYLREVMADDNIDVNTVLFGSSFCKPFDDYLNSVDSRETVKQGINEYIVEMIGTKDFQGLSLDQVCSDVMARALVLSQQLDGANFSVDTNERMRLQ